MRISDWSSDVCSSDLKEDAAKGPQITPSKAFMPVAQKLDEALKKKATAALQAAIAEGQAAATTNDDKYYLGFYTLQAGIMNKDQALQAQGLAIGRAHV